MKISSRENWLRFAGSVLRCLAAVVLLLTVAGCSSGYSLRGRVIEGDFSHLKFVSADDPRLVEGQGLDGAMVMVFRDPGSLGRKLAARSSSGSEGGFECTIGDFGAGWLVEDWEITVMRPGFANASLTGQIPRHKKDTRLLVVLARGASSPVPTRDQLLGDLDRFGNR